MRSYSNLILFEAVLDSIKSSNLEAYDLADMVLSPRLEIVEEDCGTLLGKRKQLTKEVLGEVELATDSRLTWDRAKYLLSIGTYTTGFRDISTCTSKKGICKKCYQASRPLSQVSVGNVVKIDPLYVVSAESFVLYSSESNSSAEVLMKLFPEDVDYIYVYKNGELLHQPDYSFVENTSKLIINQSIEEKTILTIKYVNNTRSQYVIWLSGYFSGSLLGMKPLPGQGLHVREALLTQNIPVSKVEALLQTLTDSGNVPEHFLEYGSKISNILEKTLYLLFLAGIFTN